MSAAENITTPNEEVVPREAKKVSLPLAVGIFFIPYIFAWVTLKKGYSSTAKGISFAWLAVILIGAMNRGGTSNSDAATTSSSAVSSSEVHASLNQEFRLGDFSYKIKKIQSKSMIGNEFVNHRAGEGATLIIVNFDIKNEGNQTDTIMTDDFKIVDSRGREFSPSSELTTAIAMSTGKDFILKEVQPGLASNTYTGFEVPVDVVKNGFKLVVPEKGWGSKRGIIEFAGN